MSILERQQVKKIERELEELKARVLALEMQKRPVEAIGYPADNPVRVERKTITLRGRAA